jgi:hypothetical protein
VRGDFGVCEFGSDHDVNESAGGLYQPIRMSLNHLKFAVESDENESQWLCNRETGMLKYVF